MAIVGDVFLDTGDIYVQTSDQRHPLGTRGYTKDGRAFRYAKCGATGIAVAVLVQQEGPDSDYNEDLNPATATAPTTGSTTITLELATAATIAANELAEGYLWINDGTGQGQYVQLEGNAADAGAATGDFDVYIRPEDCFTVAPTTSCEMGCIKNKYDDVIIRPDSARTGVPVGVTTRAITANYYFWLQTWGPVPMLLSDASDIGVPVTDDTISATGTAGAVHSIRTTSTGAAAVAGAVSFESGMQIGNAMNAGAASEYHMVDLQLAP